MSFRSFLRSSPALVLFLAGCPGSGVAGDAATPDAPDARTDAAIVCETARQPFELGDVTGHPDPLGAASGEARAGRVSAADLPPDPSGLATWADGDYVLANDRFAIVVSSPEHYEVYDPHGGRVRGLARVQDGALVDAADFNLQMLGVGSVVIGTTDVTVLADGRDGGAAIVRVTGPLDPIDALGSLLDTLVPSNYDDVLAALDYVLEPGADTIAVRISLRTDARTFRAAFGTAAFFQSFRMPIWSESSGFEGAMGAQRFVVFEDPDSTSYAWVAPPLASGAPGMISTLLSMDGFDFFTVGGVTIPPCEERTIELGRFAIGEADGMNGVQRVLGRVLETPLRRIEGTLTSDDPDAIAGARVHLTSASDDAHLTRTVVDASGTFDLHVPEGDVEAWVWREGAGLEGPFAVPSDGVVTIPLAPVATVRVDVSDAATAATLPARVQLFPTSAPPTAPASFGERELGRGRSRLELTSSDGHVDLRVAPGTYRLVVSRGWEMERLDRTLTLAAGDDVTVDAALVRAFDTPGLMCADYHIHTHRSVDSDDTGRAKVSALVADGLEIAIRSDHEWVDDFQSVIDELGLADFAIGVTGEELTTFTYGHFGVFPLVVDSTRPSGGAVTWFGRLAPDVFDEVRARPESPLLIINHPRAGGIRQGYFTEAGYDPVTGMVAHPENWDDEFDVVEVFNSGDFERFRDSTVADWFSLLNGGRRVMTVGSSDSHHTSEDPVGYPRTCLRIGEDDPRALTAERIRDVTHAGASFVTGGIYVEAVGPMGIGPGETATGVGARASIDVTLRAASFVDVDQLEVIVNGVTVETIPIADSIDPVRLEETIEVDVPTTGAWVVLHASASTEPDIAYGGRPFAVTNPMFLEP